MPIRYRKYRKQLYSARQSGRLQDPQTYDPYSDESATIDMHIGAIIQNYRINKLRRGWSLGMPKRVRDGLNPTRLPYGYTHTNSKQPPALDRANRQQASVAMQNLDFSRIPEFLATGDARQINRLLIAWFQEIRVGAEKIELIKR